MVSYTLRNIARITYLELLFSLRIPASVTFVFFAPSLLLLLVGSRFDDIAFLLPGLIGLTTATSTMQGVGQVASSMRFGIWKTLQAALHPAWLYLVGLLLSRIIRTLLVTCFMLLLAAVAFDYWLEGSLLLYLAMILLGSCSFASIGLLLAYLPKSAMSASSMINLSVFLMTIVSGVFFRPTDLLAALSYLSPMTYLINLLRAGMGGFGGAAPSLLVDAGVLLLWLVGAGWAAYRLAASREED